MNLDQLPLACRAIATALEQTGGAITPEIKQELDAIPITDWSKADAIIDTIRWAEAREAALKAEAAPHVLAAAPFMARAKAAGKAVDQLKEHLEARMKASGVTELEGPLHKCRLQDNPAPTFTLDNPDVIPAEVSETITKLDLAKAKVLFKAKNLPPGIHGKVDTHLRIDR